MKYSTPLFWLLIASFSLSAQINHNFSFEKLKGDTAEGWSTFGDGSHNVRYEQGIAQSGKVSGLIENEGPNNGFKALSYTIPANFGGKKIKLTGYLKTQDVREGFAGLWLRVDPNVAFDNMQSRQITGTNDWTKYEIELDYEPRATQIVFGGLLVGKGAIWIDNFELTIDGKPLDEAPTKELSKAQKDKEFDTGSLITADALNALSTADLDLLGRVWGFLKYHHPALAEGDYNWDYELFRILSKYTKAPSEVARHQVLVDWIAKYGPIKPCKNCKNPSEAAFLKPDLAWMSSDNLSKELKAALQQVYKGRHQGDHYYVGTYMRVGNAEFKNEATYSEMPYPDAGFRLLCLYRYWNMINYYFPYKHLMDKDWNDVLSEYIPRFINAENELAYEIATLQIIGDVQDTHANLWGGNEKIQEQRGNYYAPVHVRFIENQLVVDNFFDDERSKASGLQIGDIITHINGKKVEDIVEELNPYYPASNQPTRLRDISFDMLRSQQNIMVVKLRRNATELEKTLNLHPSSEIEGYYRWFKERTERSFKKLKKDIGYISLQNIKEEDVEPLKEVFKNTKGLIIDIRNYPSTFVPFTLGNYTNPNRTDFVKFTRVNPNNPGEFNFDEGLKVGIKRSWSYKGDKVVVLVNELSQSQAEYTAMAFQAGEKTTVIGSTTAGADGNVSRIDLPGGMRTMISGIGVYYPDGCETQRVGIRTDSHIKPTVEGIKEGRDEVLEKAIEIIENSSPLTKK
jgi:C-terminal processing protease CtpA/Prc